MKVAFTICSNNYLAQARVLINSFRKFNPDYKIIIGLVDELQLSIKYEDIDADEIIPMTHLHKFGIEELIDKYDIVELNTAVKPFYFKYIIEKHPNLTSIYYFDPDLKFYSSIKDLDNLVQQSSIFLTPHIYSPIPVDGYMPQESTFLNYGVFNLGFLGLNVTHNEAIRFLDWWGERTFKLGFSRVADGLFVDQLWINLAPLFFRDVKIAKDKGLNMAPWNLHEREIDKITKDGVYLNEGKKLIFYHFSSYNYLSPSTLSKYYNRYSFENTGKLKDLYNEYHLELITNCIQEYVKFDCTYINPVGPKRQNVFQKAKRKLKNVFYQ